MAPKIENCGSKYFAPTSYYIDQLKQEGKPVYKRNGVPIPEPDPRYQNPDEVKTYYRGIGSNPSGCITKRVPLSVLSNGSVTIKIGNKTYFDDDNDGTIDRYEETDGETVRRYTATRDFWEATGMTEFKNTNKQANTNNEKIDGKTDKRYGAAKTDFQRACSEIIETTQKSIQLGK